jgi:hypothetical protein
MSPHDGRCAAAGRYATTAANLPVATTSTLMIAACVAIAAVRPSGLWPLHGAALGVIAATSAIAVDETSCAVVDVAPRPLWWRTALRAIVPAVAALTWLLVHLLLRDRLPQPLSVLVLQGLAMTLAGFSISTWRRRPHRGEPGVTIAAVAAPLVVAAALARPYEHTLPLFPIWPDEPWRRSAAIWGGVALGSVTLLVAALLRDACAQHPGLLGRR